MASIALIPSRSGSKRIPHKNFVEVAGVSMVNRAVRLAASTELFDEIIVSVDSEEGAKSVSRNLAKVHLRPKHLGSDQAKTIDVIREVITSRSIDESSKICCLYPTSLLLSKERIIQASELLNKHKGRFVFAAQKTTANPLRMFSINSKKEEISFLDESSLAVNTQDLPAYFFDAGQFYWAYASTWMNETEILNSRSIPVVFNNWEAIDIDYPEDLDIALQLLRAREKGF